MNYNEQFYSQVEINSTQNPLQNHYDLKGFCFFMLFHRKRTYLIRRKYYVFDIVLGIHNKIGYFGTLLA